MKNTHLHPIYRNDYQIPAYLIHSVELKFILHAEQTQVSTRLIMQRNPASQATCDDLILAGENLVLLSIALDGQPLVRNAYQQTPDSLIISMLQKFSPVVTC